MKAALVGDSVGGGVIVSSAQTLVNVNGIPWAVLAAPVSSHGSSPHNSAVLNVTEPTVTIDGVPVVLEGSPATCGHVVISTDPLVNVNP